MTVTVRQLQTINADNPAYAFQLPLLCEVGGAKQFVYMATDQTVATSTFALSDRPTQIVIDPTLTVLASIEASGDVPAVAWAADAAEPASLRHAAMDTHANPGSNQ